jgi:HEPN domain-containing protein
LCQQCVEEYLKTRLQDAGIQAPKTHDLERLLLLLASIEPTWVSLQPQVASLTDAAVEFRYPGNWATNVEAKAAFALCLKVRKLARKSLGLRP